MEDGVFGEDRVDHLVSRGCSREPEEGAGEALWLYIHRPVVTFGPLHVPQGSSDFAPTVFRPRSTHVEIPTQQ